MNRRGAETRRENQITEEVIGSAIEIHRELKAVERLMPVHEAQLLTYLKLSGLSVGLLINFNVAVLRNGIRRLVNNFDDSSASQRLRG